MTLQPPMAPQQEVVVTDEEVMQKYNNIAKDRRGISMQDADSGRLRANFAYYDKNKDGYIDMAEYKVYLTDARNRRLPDQNNGGPNNGGPNSVATNFNAYNNANFNNQGNFNPQFNAINGSFDPSRGGAINQPEEEKPVALRYGKLPLKDLPSWWERIDTDKDGQIGLYEWRAAEKPMAEFLAMDLNGDGFVTAEEYLRYKKLQSAGSTSNDSRSESAASYMRGDNGNNGRGNFPSRGNGNGNGDQPMRKGKDKGNDKGSGNNPFRN
jgi:Ca2+-binding EF-hand superfamily protein